MWANRNGILHSSTASREDILDSRINEQLTSIYQHGLQEVPRDAFTLFQQTLADLLQQPRHYKEKWLASVEAAKARKRHHDFGAYLPEQRFMRRWLVWKPLVVVNEADSNHTLFYMAQHAYSHINNWQTAI